jgi:hypothetical protein
MSTKKDILLKSGKFIPAGTKLEKFEVCYRVVKCFFENGISANFSIYNMGKYFSGWHKKPSLSTLEKWIEAGYCRTPLGHKVEVDGQDHEGCYSWALILGIC